MTSVQKKAYIAGGMVLSTLVFPWPLIYYFMIFPVLYTGVIVPFFLWHNVLGGQFKGIAKDTLLWKIPAIIVLYLILNIGELSTFYILPFLPESLPLYILAEMVTNVSLATCILKSLFQNRALGFFILSFGQKSFFKKRGEVF